MSIKWDSFQNIVAGKPRDAEAKHHGINPVTGEELWAVPIANQQDVDDAVEAATKAYETFRFVPVEKRKEQLMKFCDLWQENAEEMTNLLCKETGKPVSLNCHWLFCECPGTTCVY
jgi:acyl-CoA reductase-like NAD-dependent aldehyde dehydrogenase